MTWKSIYGRIKDGVSEGEARSFIGPIGGACFTVQGALNQPDGVIDLTELQGKYILISSDDNGILYCFMPTANVNVAATDMNLDETTFEPTLSIPGYIGPCGFAREVVPRSFPYLHVRAKDPAQSAVVRVRRG